MSILSKSWEITWENKHLWILGFFAGLALGNSNNNFINSFIRSGIWLFQNLANILSSHNTTALVLLFISVIIWIIGTYARIGLIYEVTELGAKYGHPISRISEIFRTSTPFFLPILVMQFLVWSPIIILSIPYSLVYKSFFTNMFSNSLGSGSPSGFDSFGFFWLLSCGVALLIIPLSFIEAFAYRSLILKGSGVKGSIIHSVHLLKENVKPIVVLTLLCGIIGVIFGFLVSLILAPLLFLMLTPVMESASQCLIAGDNFNEINQCLQAKSNPIAIPITLISSIIAAAMTSVWVTFQSAAFTTAFNKLSK